MLSEGYCVCSAMKELPVRKHLRLKGFDYSHNGIYYITICVKDRHELLGKIVEHDTLITPYVQLSDYGTIVDKYINNITLKETGVFVDRYVIMPNHIHLLIILNLNENNKIKVSRQNENDKMRMSRQNENGKMMVLRQNENGAMRASRPTNAVIPNIIRSLKKMVSRELGFSIWQTSYYDHIIRNEAEYQRISQYIDENPERWAEDEFYQGL